ncbi:MAG: Ig-like domain-containing protein [Methylococcales bacterium]
MKYTDVIHQNDREIRPIAGSSTVDQSILGQAPRALGSTTVIIKVVAMDIEAVINLSVLIYGKLICLTGSSSLTGNWNTRRVAEGSHTIIAQARAATANAGQASIAINRK